MDLENFLERYSKGANMVNLLNLVCEVKGKAFMLLGGVKNAEIMPWNSVDNRRKSV